MAQTLSSASRQSCTIKLTATTDNCVGLRPAATLSLHCPALCIRVTNRARSVLQHPKSSLEHTEKVVLNTNHGQFAVQWALRATGLNAVAGKCPAGIVPASLSCKCVAGASVWPVCDLRSTRHMVWSVLCVSVCLPSPPALFSFMTHLRLFIFEHITTWTHAYDNMHLQCRRWLMRLCLRASNGRTDSVTAAETNH